MHEIFVGQVVVANPAYEAAESGSFDLFDMVLCRRIVDTDGPNCAFLCASVLGIEIGGSES